MTDLNDDDLNSNYAITNKEFKLPKNWMVVKLLDVAEIITGRTPPQKLGEYYGTDIPFVKPSNLNDSIVNRADEYLSKKGASVVPLLPAMSVLVSCIGCLGKTGINTIPIAINQQINAIIFSEIVNPKFGFFYVQTLKNWLYKNSSATVFPIINKARFQLASISIPPLNEQKRILTKLEELFTKLDAGIKYLNNSQILLKQYRQSVLQHAFEGKLTKKWRKENENNSNVESLSNFLEKIVIHQHYELEIEQIKKDSEIYGLNEFPKEWIWIRIKNIVEKIQYGNPEKATGDSNGIPVLGMRNIYDGKIIYHNLKYYPSDWPYLNKFLLQDGDILFNRTNSAKQVGKTAIYHSSYPKSVFASYLIRIKILQSNYIPLLLSYFINSIYGRKFIKSVVSQQVGQANVNGNKLSLMPIPLMSLLEQYQIIKEIEKRISKIQNIFKILESNIKYGIRLKSNILRNAFEGKLVPQDPSDEPVEILVDKIKRESELNNSISKEKSKITKKQDHNDNQ